MRFVTALAVAFLGSSVQALPVTSPADIIARIDRDPQPINHSRNSEPLARRQASGKDTTKTTDGDNVVTISKSQGTTGNKTGYSWHAIGSTDGLEKRQGSGDDTVVDDKNVVTISKSQGTTYDRVGYSWRSLGLK